MSILRLKEVPRDGTSGTEHIRIWVLGKGSIPYKLQQCVCYDSDNEMTYWEWKDLEMVDSDALDFEEEPR